MTPRSPLAVASLALGALLLFHQPAVAAVDPPSPATGHAEVVAQGVGSFTDGAFHWQFTTIPVTPTSTPIDTTAPTFVVSTGTSAIVLDGDAGPVARLAPGESTFRRAGDTTAATSVAPSGATALLISAVAGPGDASTTFTPGAGPRDLDLVRDVLNTNEALVLGSDVAALVVVTAGAVNSAGVPIAVGTPTPIAGNVTLINTSAQPATVFVALVGPRLGDVVVEEAPTPAPTAAPPPTAGSAPSAPATTTPAPPPSTDDTDTTPPTEPPAPDPTLDSDGDGLRDTDEAGFGSDPFDPDTDNDGLDDGTDRGNGCSPTSYDTDGDGFSDGSEVNAGTNCAVAGTNG